MITNLHPTHPESYRFVEHISPPTILGGEASEAVTNNELWPEGLDPKVSICIPLYGGEGFIEQTLDALERCRDLIHDVVIVDNASPDAAATLVEKRPWITLIRNEENRGFAIASNQAYRASTGETIIFLNSDALVTRAGLIELVVALYRSGSVGAAAPLTNFACTEQAIAPCFSHLDNLERFASDVARREVDDTDSDFVIGFCVALRRRTLEELGPFDERFETGGAEDLELSYRLRRSGYRVMVAQRSYIHHLGSQTFSRVQGEVNLQALFRKNDAKFHQKWAGDVACGFASHLSGQSRERIRFDESKRPNPNRFAKVAKQAGISLCMIVKDEERVIAECLTSAKPYFNEMLILDTGSSDRTVEIAEAHGAVVTRGTWDDSFAKARTESMRDAKGQWIMWLDADDTLPEHCGEIILNAVISAPRDVIAFVVPVRFVEEHGFGTEVDHVKVFRNFPGIEWEGRIHEQVLASLRQCATKAGIPDGGQIARLDAYVLHSGYDTSPEGQAKKRERDARLLKLDLKDRPNHPFVLFNLGMTDHYSGKHKEAIKWLKKSIAASGPGESQLRKSYALLGASLRALGKVDEAKKALEEGLSIVPGDPEIQFYLAQIASEAGHHLAAIEGYKAVLAADISSVFTSLDPGILSFKTRHNLAAQYLQIGDYESAREQWQTSFEQNPRVDTLNTLFEAAAVHGDLATCRALLDWTRNKLGYAEEWAMMVERLSAMTSLDPIAHYDAVARMQPDNVAIRKAMALRLLSTGQVAASIDHFMWLHSHGAPEGPYFLGEIAEQNGDSRRALGWYQEALRLNPQHRETATRVARLRALFA
ncbi:MAG TPA: glycosyltransferase [Fimbriimonadaceae bacterium]|nr:glycosyltransferase [Fimbriimonadaceae bacterium]